MRTFVQTQKRGIDKQTNERTDLTLTALQTHFSPTNEQTDRQTNNWSPCSLAIILFVCENHLDCECVRESKSEEIVPANVWKYKLNAICFKMITNHKTAAAHSQKAGTEQKNRKRKWETFIWMQLQLGINDKCIQSPWHIENNTQLPSHCAIWLARLPFQATQTQTGEINAALKYISQNFHIIHSSSEGDKEDISSITIELHSQDGGILYWSSILCLLGLLLLRIQWEIRRKIQLPAYTLSS